ncbi:SAM-dependent methyltransferase [Angustibacter luteus]|uniref:SAM-dependent methyltransferase n=1 Tax=Angustibacter luteus TaxID=658456 RepID=A0ABW1JFI8_9ACTN
MTFETAWQQALYGPAGFYRRAEPAEHFRTSVGAGRLLASAVARLAEGAGLHRVVDVGSGRGALLADLHALAPGLDLVGVDVVPRPAALPDRIEWVQSPGGAALPAGLPLDGALVLAHEWLDDVPCPVVERDEDGRWRTVLVEPGSWSRTLGAAPSPAELEWLHRWWPVPPGGGEPGERAEVGLARDRAWAELVRAAPASLLVAVDYTHHRTDRPPGGSLIGYRDGAACPPVPDGACDVTAHVALDAVAAAGTAAGAARTVLVDQRTTLRALGIDGRLPDHALAGTDALGYLEGVTRASQAAELLDPAGLGGFGWLLQTTPGGQADALLDMVGG